MRDSAERSLREGNVQQSLFLNNWFDFRLKDLRMQAENRQNTHFIKALSEGLRTSGKSARDYIGSYQWTTLVEANKNDLVKLMQIYAYYYDLFLIDLEGNILFSVKKEADLGSNLFTGPYQSSLFASIVRQSLDTGETLFSDFERYAPSDNIVAGFLSAPLIDEHGDKIGVFAVQLKVDIVSRLTANTELDNASQVSYLVGSDLILRTALHSQDDVLTTKIETEQSLLWLAEHAGSGSESSIHGTDEQVFTYIGPSGQTVIGIHHALNIAQIQWSLISELDESEALAPARWLAQLTIVSLVTIFLLVLVAASLVSRRITRPLKSLVDNIELAAVGDLNQPVAVTSNDEIAQLAKAFNFMIEARLAYENELKAGAKQIQQTLSELEEQRYALDQHAIVAVTDPLGTITFANEKFSAISGYSEAELIGQNHRLLNSGHHPVEFFQGLYATLARGEVWHDEICNRAKNGHLYWVDSTIFPLVDGEGRTKSYIAIRTDITARKLAEINSENSLAIVQATLEATDNGIVVINEHHKALHYNQRLLDMFHLNRVKVIFGDVRSLLGNIAEDLVDPEAFTRVVEGLQHSGGLFSAGSIQFKDGRIFEYNSRELQLPNGEEGQVWSFGNITAQTRVAAELTRAKEEAELATQAKGDFLANMSHEIRTPMNGVLGMLNLLSSSELSAKQRHQVRLAHSSGQALLTLINDILDFSKIEAGKLEMEAIDFDLRQLLGELAESMALQAQGKGLEIVLDLTQIEHSRVKGDPTRIRQLFINLVSNALKFTSQGEIVIRAALHAGEEGEMILSASVSDTGMGIPAAQIQRLFDSFSQVDTSTTRKFGGTGLGLAIVKSLCTLMNGDVKVSSEQGRGSCFAFTLCLGVSEQAAQVRPTVDLHGVRILIIDDNETNREVLEQQLSLWGAYVTEADGASSALSILDQQAAEPFPVAIVDMQMPEMNGAELGRAIRADARFDATQLVMMTSMSEPGDAQFFADLGFAAYFPKPTTTSDLFDALAIVLGGGEALLAAKPLVTHNYLQSFTREPSRQGSEQALQGDGSHLLLVEDNVINQHVALGMLEDMGYCADIAENGAVAIDMLLKAPEASPYQLILMDCQMPVLDGYETTVKIRDGDAGERYTGINIIAMTANAMAGDRAKCLRVGMNDYIAKPIDPDQLEDNLKRYIGRGIAGQLSVVEARGDEPLAAEPSLETSRTDQSHAGGVTGNERGGSKDSSEQSRQPPIWDREGLLKRVRNNESLLLTLVKQFVLDMPGDMDLLGEAIAAADWPRVASQSHTIKGIAGNMSAKRLQLLSATLEQAALQGLGTDVESQWSNFFEQYQHLYLCLEGHLQTQEQGLVDSPSPAASSLESESLVEWMDQLRDKLEQGSYVEVSDIANFIPHCQQGREKELLDRLTAELGRFDTGGAVASVIELGELLSADAKT
ncbi:MAG: response regulator [Porticoccaceae bacterium]|nr:response regulator [Porticoccaceae bacterium]